MRKSTSQNSTNQSVNFKIVVFSLTFYFSLCAVCFAFATNSSNRSGYSQNIQSSNPQKGISSSVQQDTLLGLVGQLKAFFSFDEDHAAALELDGGPRVFRGNGTYGFALDENTRIKLTAEYLKESLDFDFYSGDTRQWVQQGAVGASYEYILKEGVIKNVAVGGHYSHAQSKDLPDITIPESNGGYLIDQRHIAGGNDLNGNAEAAVQLWQDGILALGPDYDQVHYNTKYEIQNGQNAQGLGGHIRLEQSLQNNLQLQAQTTLSQLFDNYTAGLNWIWSSNRTMALTAGLNSSYTQDHTTERNFWVNGVNVSMVWDAPPKMRRVMTVNNKAPSHESTEPLAKWVQTPAVRMPDVLAISDERITQVGGGTPFVPVTATCPLGTDVQYNNTTGQYSASGGWYQSYPSGTAAQVLVIAQNSANIMGSPSGQAACLYDLNTGPPFFMYAGELILENKTYQNAKGNSSNWITGYSQFWPGPPYPSTFCNTLFGADCSFTTVASN